MLTDTTITDSQWRQTITVNAVKDEQTTETHPIRYSQEKNKKNSIQTHMNRE